MKLSIKILVFAIIASALSVVASACTNAELPPTYYTVEYGCTDGGYIAYIFKQQVEAGGSTVEVEAVPDSGYVFSGWSDGVETPKRKEENVNSDISVTAIFTKKAFTVEYTVENNGGEILGVANQTVKYGEKSVPVTARPFDGYEFDRWSDGLLSAERYEQSVLENKTFSAIFKKIIRTFKLNGNCGTAENGATEIELSYERFEDIKLPKALREHFTFNGWYIDGEQVSDSEGNLLVGREILDLCDAELKAKWTANEKFTYKILMIYVTEVDAVLPTRSGGTAEVKYKITDLERELYRLTTIKLKEVLDAMLDGLVDFQIDEYFTTQPIGSECFGSDGADIFSLPKKFPELSKDDLRNNYQSVLTTLNFNDYNNTFCGSSGLATLKYGDVYYESCIEPLLRSGLRLEDLLDINCPYWNSFMVTYIHELIHTIETRKDYYNYHKASANLKPQTNEELLEASKMYLSGSIEIDGETIGIPYEFWKEDLENPYDDKYGW